MGEQKTTASSVNRAKTYQLVLFPLNNGATNVYYVLVLSYIATFGSKVLALSMLFASVMVTGMRLFDAITDPIIGMLYYAGVEMERVQCAYIDSEEINRLTEYIGSQSGYKKSFNTPFYQMCIRDRGSGFPFRGQEGIAWMADTERDGGSGERPAVQS